MIAKSSLVAALFFASSHLGAAQRLSHPLRAAGGEDIRVLSASPTVFPDTLKVLAIMVQFQTDNDPLTTGNGQFDVSTAPQMI
ncbi:MAG TPA: hypothetical protein VMM58_06945, partial [Bacteroidota bacterium]|nr:hypothetical protein [Bacteroidota bacterium]